MRVKKEWSFRLYGNRSIDGDGVVRLRVMTNDTPEARGRGMWLTLGPAEVDQLITALVKYRARSVPHPFKPAGRHDPACVECDAREYERIHQ